jgi:hypothetical protein
LAEEFLAPCLVDGVVDVAHHMELVEHDRGLGQVFAHAVEERLPHVDAHRLDRATPASLQILGEEAVQRGFLALRSGPDRLASSQVETTVRHLPLPQNSSSTPICRSGRRRRCLAQASNDRLSIRLTVCADRPHFAATRRTAASSQSCATAAAKRRVYGCLPSRNSIRSAHTPQRLQYTR